MTDRRLIGVFPAAEHASRRRLFDALGGAFDVGFVGRDGTDLSGLDALILVDHQGGPGQESASLPMLLATPAERSLPGEVRFEDTPEVDERLRGRVMRDEAVSVVRPGPTRIGAAVLAFGPDGPCWMTSDVDGVKVHHVGALPRELREGESLKSLLRAGSFLALLPVVQFLRELAGPPLEHNPPRASFILDDPNLHWKSYGHINYPELANHAARHRYHVGIAMVPIDARFAHRPTVDLFRTRPELSLLIHGNDHVKWELARPHSSSAALAIAAQSLRRMARFEHKNAIDICRVIVPPHDDCTLERTSGFHPPPGACSEEMMEALLLTGFEAVCYYGPTGDSTGRSLVGWFPADVHVGGGLPGIHRVTFDAPVDELVLRWYLDQPLILFGHHGNLADLELLAEAAGRVNSLGEVAWHSMRGIARSNFSARRDGSTLELRSFARCLTVEVPEGVDQIKVDFAGAQVDGPRELAMAPAAGSQAVVSANGAAVGQAVGVTGSGAVEITAIATRSANPYEIPPVPWKPWPVLRRCLTEGRDRLTPLIRR